MGKDKDVKCEYCEYADYKQYKGAEIGEVECRRNPEYVTRYASHWCGEFKLDTARLPHKHVVTTITNIPVSANDPLKREISTVCTCGAIGRADYLPYSRSGRISDWIWEDPK